MTFNSIAYLIFLPAVFFLYWLLQKYPLRWQNALILAASYLFYGWWDWRFLSLLAFSTFADFSIGRWLQRTQKERHRRCILALSLLVNLGLLSFFKYFNFFAESLGALAASAGWHADPFTLNVILPLGISFYTFQSLSYTIDIYRRQLTPTRDWVAFAAFVAFFPQLVAGPIERAGHLLPQFLLRRTFRYEQAVSGCRLMLWGFLKKVVIADNLAPVADYVFGQPDLQNVWTVSLGALCFAGQIYGDFSGYSDIAIGSARLFGFDLMQNFRAPYFAGSIREFWQRWHISLSTWFRDYVYIPLGGNRLGRRRQVINLLATFALSGLWHGANWTFVVWGCWHGALAGLESVSGFRAPMSGLRRLASNVVVFTLVCLGWIFFRAENLDTALVLLGKLAVQPVAVGFPADVFSSPAKAALLLAVLLFFGVLEWHTQDKGFDEWLSGRSRLLRWTVYYFLTGIILLLGVFDNAPVFIYFQF